MLNKKLVASKGYTLYVTSWENDGDNYKTNTLTVQDKEHAIIIVKMCKDLFKSFDEDEFTGIGNTIEDSFEEEMAKNIIIDYLIKNPEIFKYYDVKTIDDYKEDIIKLFPDEDNYIEYVPDFMNENTKIKEKFVNFVMDKINRPLLGYCFDEGYFSRVFDSYEITYSADDIYVEKLMDVIK